MVKPPSAALRNSACGLTVYRDRATSGMIDGGYDGESEDIAETNARAIFGNVIKPRDSGFSRRRLPPVFLSNIRADFFLNPSVVDQSVHCPCTLLGSGVYRDTALV